jgi:short subunit dehydrogenase-like uncharacterized protein
VTARPFDLVLFGATGFTGKLTASYLAEHGPPGLRVALAGRNAEKLDAVRKETGGKFEVRVADVSDAGALARLAAETKVVLTTVGPFERHGEPVVKACIEGGAHYADITGEPQFVDRMIVRYDAEAKAKKLRIVSCCGFDSIPHDLGVHYTVGLLPKNVPITIDGFVRAKGGVSGGTYQSALHAMAHSGELRAARDARKKSEAPLVGRKVGSARPKLHFDDRIKAWAVPLPTIDPDVIARSARALDEYGPEFRYAHYLSVKKTTTMAGLVGGVGALFALAQLPPTRKLLEGLRSSGEGPDEETRKNGKFEVRFFAEGGGTKLETRVAGGEPGYTETAKMLSESALCLAFDQLPERYGVITTAMAMGSVLQARLQKAGITFERV